MAGGLLRHRDFRLLWTADLLSQFGDRITVLAVPLLAATTLHASAFEVSTLRTVQTLAYLVLGLQVGAWCDRLRTRPILIATDLGRCVVYASVPLASALGVLSLAQLLAVVAVAGVLAVFFEVGHQTYLPRLIPPDRLVEGNAKLQTNSMAAVAAPSAGGYLVQYFGGAVAIAVNAASFLWSALWLRRIRTPERIPERPAPEPLRREIREGLGFVLGHPVLRPLAETITLTSLFQSMQLALGVVFLLSEIHLSPGEIGLVSTTGLLGALVGALYGRRIGQRFGEARMLWVSEVLLAAGYVLMALTRPGWLVACYPLGNVVTSFGIVVSNILRVSFQQAATPERLRGRVNATMRFLIFGVAPVGSLLGGVLAGSAGLRVVMWVAAGGLAVAAVRLVWSPVRRMRTLPQTVH